MGGAEAVAGRKLPAVADADPSGSIPAAAPARTWGSAMGEGCGFCAEDARAGRENMVGKVGWGMITLNISVDLSLQF